MLLQYEPCTVQTYRMPAAQCVEVSWTSAFLLPRALTDLLFLLFVPSALRGVQHVTICAFQFCKSFFVVHLLFSFSWNVSSGFGSEKLEWFGVRGGWPPQYFHQMGWNGTNLTKKTCSPKPSDGGDCCFCLWPTTVSVL